MRFIVSLLLVFSLHSFRFKAASLGKKYLLFVDPLDEYGNAAQVFNACLEREIECVSVWSSAISRSLLSAEDDTLTATERKNIETSTYKGDIEEWIAGFLNADDDDLDIPTFLDHCIGVISETDTGLRAAEDMAASLDIFSSNGVNEGRRDKYMMQQQLLHHDTNSIRQVLTDDWEEVKNFLDSLRSPFPCVIKPSRGSGSKDVIKAHSWNEAEVEFHALLGTPGYANGSLSDAVLVQEFVVGTEYVVDTVSRDGEHKIVAVWKYDKRPVNKAPFVYYSTEILQKDDVDVHVDDDVFVAMVLNYTTKVLDALDVKWGPCHLEVLLSHHNASHNSTSHNSASYDSDIPVLQEADIVLVEANVGRFHGQDFVKLCTAAYGYNAVDVTVDALLSGWDEWWQAQVGGPYKSGGGDGDGDDGGGDNEGCSEKGAYSRWTSIPTCPPTPRCGARIVNLVSYRQGVMLNPPAHTAEMTSLPSIEKFKMNYEVGDYVEPTIDLSTMLGYALLIHPDHAVVDSDYATLTDLQRTMLDT